MKVRFDGYDTMQMSGKDMWNTRKRRPLVSSLPGHDVVVDADDDCCTWESVMVTDGTVFAETLQQLVRL